MGVFSVNSVPSVVKVLLIQVCYSAASDAPADRPA
jgi:hypothetical protein